MIRILRSLWIWSAGTMLIVVWLPLLATVRLFDRDPARRATGRWFRALGRALAKLNPWRLHIAGLENVDRAQVYVVVSNHQSLADIPIVSHIRLDTKWLAKAELFRLPVIGWMLRMAGDIPVERGDKRKAARAFLQAARYLRQHCSIVFFPEGTRSLDGQVLPFNEGPFQLAIREKVPILPIVVEGSGSALPRNSWLFGGTLDIQVRVLPPVPVTNWDPKQSSALRDSVREAIISEISVLRAFTANSRDIRR